MVLSTVKTIYGGKERGYDGNKKIKGRKRSIITDILGCIVGIYVSMANTHDTVLGPTVIAKTLVTYPNIKGFAVDKGYRGTTFDYIKALRKKCFVPEIEIGKKVSPKRWIVERTFSWLGHDRRLSKDYEVLPAIAETFIKIGGG